MPLTENQLHAIEALMQGQTELPDGSSVPDNLNTRINAIVEARDHVMALVHIHQDIPDAVVVTVLSKAKQRAIVAAQSIVELLS